MTLYRYSGPLTSFTLADGRDVILAPGATVDLPECDVVTTLAALGRLTPVEAATAPAPAAPKPKKGE